MMRPSWNVSWWEAHVVRTSSLPIMQDTALQDWNETHRDRQFHIWHREQDYEYCHCATGSYRNAEGSTLFYVRAPGNEVPPDYARQILQEDAVEGTRWLYGQLPVGQKKQEMRLLLLLSDFRCQ